jgi:hypothetical protein
VKKGPQQQANNVSFIMSYKVGHHGPEKKKLKNQKKEEYCIYILRTMPVEWGPPMNFLFVMPLPVIQW